MRYMLLIYSDPTHIDNLSKAEQIARTQTYAALAQEMTQSGMPITGEALQPITTATTVRVRNGKTLTTDGPFANTTEQLIAYHILHAKNLDQALDFAARLPDANHGSIEIRPLYELSRQEQSGSTV